MAAADYRLCDVCDGKVFYDANLNYEQGRDDEWAKRKAPFRWAGEEQGKPEHDDWLLRLDYLGDWAVLCGECSKTHRTQIVPIAAPQAEPKPLSAVDADYWARHRQAILDAIERAGFVLMSNANRFWLRPAPAAPKEHP